MQVEFSIVQTRTFLVQSENVPDEILAKGPDAIRDYLAYTAFDDLDAHLSETVNEVTIHTDLEENNNVD